MAASSEIPERGLGMACKLPITRPPPEPNKRAHLKMCTTSSNFRRGGHRGSCDGDSKHLKRLQRHVDGDGV